MTGVKGRSGGPRKNAGGARPGAGRPPKPKPEPAILPPEAEKKDESGAFDPRPSLELIAKGLLEVTPQQYKALAALLPYAHRKLGEGGKKEEQTDKAKKAGAGKFASAAPPLKLVGKK